MYRKYLVTGATGYLGSAVVRRLLAKGVSVRALVLPDDPNNLPAAVNTVYGRVDERASLKSFFEGAQADTCVIHCAGIVSILSKPGELLRQVNVTGTQNILSLCREHAVGKLIYVSSVHAIPEKPHGEQITEVASFSPEYVSGAYAKTKAEATACVLKAAKEGLNACVVHPSGIIGACDPGSGSITGMVRSYCAGKFHVGVQGGYDFVDVNDVAQGIVNCCEKGKAGECYILSNRFVTIREFLDILRSITGGRRVSVYVSRRLAALVAPICEKLSLRRKQKPFFTPYSIETLGANANFSHAKATAELGYHPRSITKTLTEMVLWMQGEPRPAKSRRRLQIRRRKGRLRLRFSKALLPPDGNFGDSE